MRKALQELKNKSAMPAAKAAAAEKEAAESRAILNTDAMSSLAESLNTLANATKAQTDVWKVFVGLYKKAVSCFFLVHC